MASIILVLEDDPALRELLCEVLEEEGHTVVAAATLPELLEVIPPRIDLLISDVLVDLVPVGFEAIQAIRERGYTDVPTILCTGATRHLEYYQEQIAEIGAMVLNKPFSIDSLLQAVDDALTDRSLSS